MLRSLALLAAPALVAAHGNMLYPYAWWDANGTVGVYPGATCAPGCGEATGGPKVEGCEAFCMWFSDFTMLDDGVKTTLAEDSPLRTYLDINIHALDPQAPDAPIDIYGNHPWKHPGKAPVWSPCGIGGGNPRGCFQPGTQNPIPCPAGAANKGPDARFFAFPDVKTTVWKLGGVAETAWQVNANHGGGYQYRLCPLQTASQPPGLPIDEACFQS